MRGAGLWDEIWGYVAIEQDYRTVAGVAFDHTAETPGLGAEIKDNKIWCAQFVGKKITDDNGNFKSIGVIKGPIEEEVHQVSAISGATVTSDGVNEMLFQDIKDYLVYFNKQKNS